MRKIAIVGLLLLAVPRLAWAALDYVIIPGQRVGEIRASTSESDLIRIYGSSNVVKSDVYVGEGESVPGTTLFAGDAERTLQIIWKSTPVMSNPESIYVQGKRWRTTNGLGLDSSLKEIEKLNGGPIEIFGFEWDYGGTIANCLDGKLNYLGTNGPTGLQGRTLIMRLAPESHVWDTIQREEMDQVMGDRIYRSDDPVMQKLNPRAYQVIVTFKSQ